MFFPSGPKSDEFVAIRIKTSKIEIINFSKNITPEPFGLKLFLSHFHEKLAFYSLLVFFVKSE